MEEKWWTIVIGATVNREEWMRNLRDAWYAVYKEPLPMEVRLVVPNHPKCVQLYCDSETIERLLDLNDLYDMF